MTDHIQTQAATASSTAQTPDEFRKAASLHEQAKAESFERCDTDGFMTQWAHGLGSTRDRMKANLVENNGLWKFPCLFDLDGNYVHAVLINGKYGTSWMLLDEDGQRTGKYISAFPKRESTIKNKGYLEGYAEFEAYVDYKGNDICDVRPHFIRKFNSRPVNIVSTNRWQEEQ